MRLIHRIAPAVALVLAACMAAPEPEMPVFDSTPRCGADRLQGLIGQNASVLSTMEIGVPMRVIHPGMAVTMDYNPGRLNVDVDEHGIITRVWCA